jgi:hypothetical protein
MKTDVSHNILKQGSQRDSSYLKLQVVWECCSEIQECLPAFGRQPYNTDQYRRGSTICSTTSTEIYAITFLGKDTSKTPSSSTRQKE